MSALSEKLKRLDTMNAGLRVATARFQIAREGHRPQAEQSELFMDLMEATALVQIASGEAVVEMCSQVYLPVAAEVKR